MDGPKWTSCGDGRLADGSVISPEETIITKEEISIFPNPSTGNCELNIETANKGDYTIFINDMSGKELYREKVLVDKEDFKHVFNNAEFKCGMYNCIHENEITKERVNIRIMRQ